MVSALKAAADDFEMSTTAFLASQSRALFEWRNETADEDNVKQVENEVNRKTLDSFALISRLGMSSRKSSATSSPAGSRWKVATAKASANNAAVRMRQAARLKALQRTPYPMVLARIKMLLDRLQAMQNVSPLRMRRSIAGSKSMKLMMSMKNMMRGPSISGRGSFTRGTQNGPAEDESVLGADEYDAVGGGRLSPEKIIEELTVTFAFISDFLRKIPEEMREDLCNVVYMESFKKDQTVYEAGDEAEKFYIILTGSVELRRATQMNSRAVISTLKKGQVYGEQALLNDEPRRETAIPSSNCSFLTVNKADFLEVLGPYFNEQRAQAISFFKEHIHMFGPPCPEEEAAHVINHMHLSAYPPGNEWEPINEQQVFFLKSGSCAVETYERRSLASITEIPRLRANDETPFLAESGPLANVEIRNGRVVGTLGHEEELRKLRRSLMPKKMMAQLEAGSVFGGGTQVMGDGELQSSMKVVAETQVELYHIHIEEFIRYATPELLQSLRDDVAFTLTYYYARIGTINNDVIVGHHDASLVKPPSMIELKSNDKVKNHSSPKRKTAKVHAMHVAGELSSEVKKIIDHIDSLHSAFNGDGRARHNEHGTPAQRYWSAEQLSGQARMTVILPLMGQIYTDGLAPLVDKVEELDERTRKREMAVSEAPWMYSPRYANPATGPSPFAGGTLGTSSSDSGAVAAPVIPGPAPPPQPAAWWPTPRPPTSGSVTPSRLKRASLGAAMASRESGSGMPGENPYRVSFFGNDESGGLPGGNSSLKAPSLDILRIDGEKKLLNSTSERNISNTTSNNNSNSNPVTSNLINSSMMMSKSASGDFDSGLFAGFQSLLPVNSFGIQPFQQDKLAMTEGRSVRRKSARAGAITAAGIIWERSSAENYRYTPAMRQVLTYEEIHCKRETARRTVINALTTTGSRPTMSAISEAAAVSLSTIIPELPPQAKFPGAAGGQLVSMRSVIAPTATVQRIPAQNSHGSSSSSPPPSPLKLRTAKTTSVFASTPQKSVLLHAPTSLG